MSEYDRLRALHKSLTNPTARAALLPQMAAAKRREMQEGQADAVRVQIRQCRNCDLGRVRRHAVPFTGPTHGKGDIILVGEAPGNTEDRLAEPFVGNAGKALDKLLIQAGTHRDRCFIMNALCCIPREGKSFREPAQVELDACRPNFEDQLVISGLKIGVALGGYAWGAVTKQQRHIIKVSKLIESETTAWVDGRIWIPAYHPSYALRKAAEEEEGMVGKTIADRIVESLRWALAMRKGTVMFPKLPLEKLEFEGKSSEDIKAGIKKKGWALVYSTTLGGQVVVTDPRKAVRNMPRNIDELVPKYTTEELVRLGLLGAENGWTVGDLRRLHYVKSEMGGEIIA